MPQTLDRFTAYTLARAQTHPRPCGIQLDLPFQPVPLAISLRLPDRIEPASQPVPRKSDEATLSPL